MANRFAPIVEANSIAIIGASADPAKLAGRPLSFLRKYGFPGALYPVNPARSEIMGLPSAPSIAAIGAPVDLALVVTAAERVIDSVREAAEAGVSHFMIFSSGFAEMGDDGALMQQQLADLVVRHDLTIQGPNCTGTINAHRRMCATISSVAHDITLRPGGFAFAGHSGALASAWLDNALNAGLGFSSFITTGNEVDLTLADAVDYLAEDPNTDVIALYIEGARDGRLLRSAFEKAAIAGKHVLALKSGSSAAGMAAAASHTGSVAGEDGVWDAVFRYYGVRRVQSLTEMVEAGKLLLWQPKRTSAKPAVISISGGAAALFSDAASDAGLIVNDFSPETKAQLTAILPDYAHAQNPLDVTGTMAGDTVVLKKTAAILSEADGFDSMIVLITLVNGVVDALIDGFSQVLADGKQMIAAVWMGANEATIAKMEGAGIPVYRDIPEGVRAFALGGAGGSASFIPGASKKLDRRPTSGGALSESQSQSLVRAVTNWPRQSLFADLTDGTLDYPVVAKLQSAGMPHKSDMGGVVLNIRDREELDRVADRFATLATSLNIELEGVLVQEMIAGEYELFAGIRQDETFGPILVFGRGGIHIETDPDVQIVMLPTTEIEIERGLRSLRSAKLFDGVRGKPPLAMDELIKTLMRLTQVYEQERTLVEVEINPIAIRNGKPVALDALAIVSREPDACA